MDQQFPGLGPDKVVLITAGATGIGCVMAKAFLEQGCRVHICDINDVHIDRFRAEHPEASASLCDVSNATQVSNMFAELESRRGRLDILLNNAGIAGPTAAIEDIAPDEWERTINVDLNGAFYCTRLAVPLLKERGGVIINMASNAAFFGVPLRSPYAAAKWALHGLTKTWAMELGSSHVRVNALCPGSVNGKRIDAVIGRDAAMRGIEVQQVRDSYARQSSMHLFVDPEDIANMALFLASDLGKTISGQAIGIDGHTESLSLN